jgi:hypothetical protein
MELELTASKVISTILKHDRKVTSYKIALLRAINDVVLSFPDVITFQQDIAIPLRLLAEYWVAYYWVFVESDRPIFQGQRSNRDGTVRNDMEFREKLTQLRTQWETFNGTLSQPADGFFLINELRVPRKRATYPASLLQTYTQTIQAISRTLEMPIRYAGPENWSVFEKPATYATLRDCTIAVPGTQPQDKCLVIKASLWQTFQVMSLWVEALCIHEWCLFTERVTQQFADRGMVYSLLTARPDNRRPLTWEINNIDLLLMEGNEFVCPWTAKRIVQGVDYDLDHLLPLAVFPINELWNLSPADPKFNRHTKRDRLPSLERLQQTQPHLAWNYERYGSSKPLAQALQEDVGIRFSTVRSLGREAFPQAVANAVVGFIDQVAESRNLARF